MTFRLSTFFHDTNHCQNMICIDSKIAFQLTDTMSFIYMFIKDTGKRNIYVYFSDLMMPSLIKYAIEFKYMHQQGDISLYGLT